MADGSKVLIWGNFGVNQSYNSVAQLNPDGTLDPTFNLIQFGLPGSSPWVASLATSKSAERRKVWHIRRLESREGGRGGAQILA